MLLDEYERNGFTVKIMHDEVSHNPREEYEHIGEILQLHNRYVLGDRSCTQEEIEELIERDDVFSLSVYAHIHSGVQLSTGEFADPFDSGQCGAIYCTLEKAKSNWPNLEGEELKKAVESCLEAEVQEFSWYLSGNVYGYVIEGPIGEIDSCWGILGSDNVKEEANAAADNAVMPMSCEQQMESCNEYSEGVKLAGN